MQHDRSVDMMGLGSSESSFNEIKISLASPEKILSWSYGEVKKPETINYRTFKPERDGLFCARIFGPIKDYECLCGKYKRMKYRGITCEKCGVEVALQKVRRERMGHIELAAPVAHIWFLKSLPSRIAILLDISLRNLERVLYFEQYIVIESGMTTLRAGELLTEEDLRDAQDQWGMDGFKAGIGAKAIRDMLGRIDLDDELLRLHQDLAEAKGDQKPKKILKRLKLVEHFVESGNRPEWMILTVIPVIPPELRPLVPLDGGRFATSDLNDLYRRVINRNNRLKRLIELRAPSIIIRNEERMLQESVDALFDNGRRGRVVTGANKRPLKSLADMLKGKQGRFRQNLLGKRVDFSGRSVIVSGPELKLHQCGIPKRMALELFKPFIYASLDARGSASTVKQAKKLLEKEKPEVWDILDEVIREHPVLLNRAPTLHRLGIQAFEPVLVDGKAIQLHPLVCSAFNADFDGDQMAVHVPLSIEAQLEARILMMSTNNVLSPANGKPIIVPSQDMVLGLYYLSIIDQVSIEEKDLHVFSDINEAEYALTSGVIGKHTPIRVRIYSDFEDPKIYVTTVGRCRLALLLPKNKNITFEIVNRVLRKREVGELIDAVYRHCGLKDSVVFCDRIMVLGFREACCAGISFGMEDMVVPDEKWDIVESTRSEIKAFEQQYMDGLITQVEKYNKVIDAWSKCTDKVSEVMMDKISSPSSNISGKSVEHNSLYMMSFSGARGSVTQMRQLAAMRGLMAKPSGEIIETPIISNFKEGLNVLEYFNSTHGARKGLADTALKTANSGYLTRRLVDVAQDCIIRTHDCGTDRSITTQAVVDGGVVRTSLAENILGRISAEDIKSPLSGELLFLAGHMFDENDSLEVEGAGVQVVKIRSPLVCELRDGICAQCYGRDLARGVLVNINEAVGIIAAQSIGEPGTQLTMRTFHIGGTAEVAERSYLEAEYEGKVEFRNSNFINTGDGRSVVMGSGMRVAIIGADGSEIVLYKLSYGYRLYVCNGDEIVRGQRLAEWDPYTRPIISEKSGVARFIDLIPNVTVQEEMDESTGISQRIVTDWKASKGSAALRPAICVTDPVSGEVLTLDNNSAASYYAPVSAILSVDDGQHVKAGDVLARLPREGARTRDITGGLPRVAELFEARRPKDHAIIAGIDGYVKFGKDFKNKRCIVIEASDGSGESQECLFAKIRHVTVQEGSFVQKGDCIVDGKYAPHDILSTLGVEALASYLINEIQEVYRLQGVKINDKHIEVIIRQMLQKVEVTDPGDSELIVGEQVDRIEFGDINKALEGKGMQIASATPVLLGITKASLQTRSFISAASFQETTRVLTDAAVKGKKDCLRGLKENVIVGRLIPSGTGGVFAALKRLALRKDKRLAEQTPELCIDRNQNDNGSC